MNLENKTFHFRDLNKKSFLFLIALSIGFSAEAIEVQNWDIVKKAPPSSSGSRSSRSSGSDIFSGGLILTMGQGQMGNDSTVLDRSMAFFSGSVFLGLNWGAIRLGPIYEYSYVGQLDDPASFSNQNIEGKGSMLGARLDYYDGKNSFGFIYRISDRYELGKANAAGDFDIYKSNAGYQVQYYRQIKKKIGFVIDYTIETFDDSLSDSVKWDRISIGLVLTNFKN